MRPRPSATFSLREKENKSRGASRPYGSCFPSPEGEGVPRGAHSPVRAERVRGCFPWSTNHCSRFCQDSTPSPTEPGDPPPDRRGRFFLTVSGSALTPKSSHRCARQRRPVAARCLASFSFVAWCDGRGDVPVLSAWAFLSARREWCPDRACHPPTRRSSEYWCKRRSCP